MVASFLLPVNRLLTPILILCVVFSSLMGAAILVGRGQGSPEYPALLNLTDCAPPCWLGIVPGVTSLSDAIPGIEARYSNIPGYSSTFSEGPVSFTTYVSNVQNPADTFTLIVRTYDNRLISTIGFDMSHSRSGPNLGELSELLGPPTHIILAATSPGTGLTSYTLAFSAHDCISVTVITDPDNRADIYQRPDNFYFGETGRCDASAKLPPWQAWRGFKSMAAYVH